MKTLQEKIDVMQAAEDGKKIEWSTYSYTDWTTCIQPNFNWDEFDYRVKAELYEGYKPMFSGAQMRTVYDTREEAEAEGSEFHDYIKTIKVREVPE